MRELLSYLQPAPDPARVKNIKELVEALDRFRAEREIDRARALVSGYICARRVFRPMLPPQVICARARTRVERLQTNAVALT